MSGTITWGEFLTATGPFRDFDGFLCFRVWLVFESEALVGVSMIPSLEIPAGVYLIV